MKTTTLIGVAFSGSCLLFWLLHAGKVGRRPKQDSGVSNLKLTLHKTSSTGLISGLTKRGVDFDAADVEPHHNNGHGVVDTIQTPEGMRDDTCAAYTALYYYRFVDLPKNLDLALLVPTHPEVDRKGHPYLNTLAIMRVPALTRQIISQMAERIRGLHPTVLIAFETRAMAFGAVLAYHCNCAFVPARKQCDTVGINVIESTVEDTGSYRDACSVAIDGNPFIRGDRVVVVDDVISSGATLRTLTELIRTRCSAVDVVGEIAIVNFQDPERGILNITNTI